MSRILWSLALALLVTIGGACEKSVSPRGDSRHRSTAEEGFSQLDTNKDGKLSMQEFRGKATRAEDIAILDNEFNAADTNHDGFLSLDEYKAYFQKIHGDRRGRNGPRGGNP
jgi:Ca2+-binding EF-hand superfamily protein